MIETGIGFPNPLFFIGVVENNLDGRLEGRVQVRAFGIHGTNKEIPTEDLPWATLIIGSHDVNFVVPPLNAWVFGFFIDGRSAQQPFVLGLIPTQFTQINDPALSGWGVALGNAVDVNAQGSRGQDFGQPTLSRLARGENLEETYLLPLETTRRRNVPIAGGKASLGSVGNMGVAGGDTMPDASIAGDPAATDIVEVVETGPGYNVVRLADGSVVRQEGARNWRNNNPGNLEYGDFAKRYGAITTDGRFAIFPSYQSGRRAKEALLFESSSYSGMTIEQAINRYAPPNENNTSSYTNTVADAAGVSPNTKMSSLSAQQRSTMLDAMQRVEGFSQGQTTAADSTGTMAPTLVSSGSADNQNPAGGSDTATTQGGQPTWDEPSVAYNAEYPYNRVIETGSGHVIELDDTPGGERVMIYHRNGSYIQMSPTTTTIKSPNDMYSVNEKNYHMYVGGTNVITIEGDSHVLIKGNKIEEIMGNYQQIIHGNHEVGVAGQMNMNGGEQGQIRAANLILESNVENLNIKTGKNIKFESGESIHFKTKDLFMQGSETINVKGKNVFMESSATTSIKSETGVMEAAGNFSIKADHAIIGGGQLVSVNASTVAIDSVIELSKGTSGTPDSAETAADAGSAKSVQRPAPPAKSPPSKTSLA
jgi:hypothetical protein